jgi:hypothetical protein
MIHFWLTIDLAVEKLDILASLRQSFKQGQQL